MNWPAIPTMGGYAFYVWGAYLVTISAIGGEMLFLLRRRRALRDGQVQA